MLMRRQGQGYPAKIPRDRRPLLEITPLRLLASPWLHPDVVQQRPVRVGYPGGGAVEPAPAIVLF
jgi:hypothetical protein